MPWTADTVSQLLPSHLRGTVCEVSFPACQGLISCLLSSLGLSFHRLAQVLLQQALRFASGVDGVKSLRRMQDD